ncbi:putative dormancy/auxin associated protein [Helianthus annuus]|nr:putative dormancy/auxin associated protein [Helianthus annuus]
MSLLDQLWDETLAGPRPDKGLGKLRKQSTFTFRSSDSSKGTQFFNGKCYFYSTLHKLF